MKLYLLVLPFAALAAGASAQQHPAYPGGRAAQAGYESAFAGYRPFREEKLAPWREVNDEVGRIGGHAGMFRSAGGRDAKAEPSRPAPAAPARSGPPAP